MKRPSLSQLLSTARVIAIAGLLPISLVPPAYAATTAQTSSVRQSASAYTVDDNPVLSNFGKHADEDKIKERKHNVWIGAGLIGTAMLLWAWFIFIYRRDAESD